MRVTVYIKPENEQKWQEMRNKSQWVNDMLTGEEPDLDKRIKRIVERAVEEKLADLRSY